MALLLYELQSTGNGLCAARQERDTSFAPTVLISCPRTNFKGLPGGTSNLVTAHSQSVHAC